MDRLRAVGRREPRAARPAVALPAGERALAWADVAASAARSVEPVPSGRQWVGSAAALYLDEGDHGLRRLPWSEIREADWNGETQELRVAGMAPFGEREPVYTARLLGADRLLQLVRERVTAAVVLTRSIPVTDGSVRVTARRLAGRNDGLSWSVELPPGADPGNPRVGREAAAALAAVRTELGVDG